MMIDCVLSIVTISGVTKMNKIDKVFALKEITFGRKDTNNTEIKIKKKKSKCDKGKKINIVVSESDLEKDC